MPESSPAPGGSEQPFDAEQFARDTISSIEYTDEDLEQLEDRVMRLEEVIAARWPRSMVLRWRLAREIRASVRGYDASVYPRDGFRGRRIQWAAEQVSRTRQDRERRREEHQAGRQAEGDAGPGAEFLP